MASRVLKVSTKELSKTTWADFVSLFSQGNGWDHCACMHFQRLCALPRYKWLPSRADRAVRNLREKKALVEMGRSHGILIYVDKIPVGWCQFGLSEELPRIDASRNYRGLAPKNGMKTLWRITCFVVDKKHRKNGIASAALRSALEAIAERGGGLVEAYPVADWSGGAFGNMSTHGTVSMFKKQGFTVAAPFGNTNVLMRRMV
jgi:ribosomal protein S18 acetylase RimI-like enzyme